MTVDSNPDAGGLTGAIRLERDPSAAVLAPLGTETHLAIPGNGERRVGPPEAEVTRIADRDTQPATGRSARSVEVVTAENGCAVRPRSAGTSGAVAGAHLHNGWVRDSSGVLNGIRRPLRRRNGRRRNRGRPGPPLGPRMGVHRLPRHPGPGNTDRIDSDDGSRAGTGGDPPGEAVTTAGIRAEFRSLPARESFPLKTGQEPNRPGTVTGSTADRFVSRSRPATASAPVGLGTQTRRHGIGLPGRWWGRPRR